MELNVSIELNGEQIPAGLLYGDTPDETVFVYNRNYRSQWGRQPISISLPFQRDAFTPEQTRKYFEGLLPEGFTRRAVAQWMHSAENDYVNILHGLGRECLGAIRITSDEDNEVSSYEKLSLDEVRKLAEEGASKSAEMLVESHLSLTGASGKVGLYYDRKNDQWYLPRGLAPSTHIVKQSHIRFNGIVANEQLTLLTAARCGIDTAKSFIINVGEGSDREILLTSARYDRVFCEPERLISGLPAPCRLHQEDFAQALGIASEDKYEKPGENHLKKAFQLIRTASANPVEDMQKLWDLLIFNCLIGNTDCHLKNLSLLYSPDLSSVRLAPAYDILSTAVYPSCTKNMAFAVGGQSSLEKIDENALRLAAADAGLSEKQALKSLDRICNVFEGALQSAAMELKANGIPGAFSLKEKILTNGCFKHFSR